MSIKGIIDAQIHQHTILDKCNAILQHVQSCKEEIELIHQDMKQILKKSDGELPQPLDILNDSLRALSDELNSSNAEHRESILNLKVCWPCCRIHFLCIHAHPSSHNTVRCRQKMSGKHYMRNLAMNGWFHQIWEMNSRGRRSCEVLKRMSLRSKRLVKWLLVHNSFLVVNYQSFVILSCRDIGEASTTVETTWKIRSIVWAKENGCIRRNWKCRKDDEHDSCSGIEAEYWDGASCPSQRLCSGKGC